MRWRRSVVEDMSQVGIALPAPYLNAPHAESGVGFGFDILFRNGRPEAGPAGARLEFGFRAE
jgi:hypothetical protein